MVAARGGIRNSNGAARFIVEAPKATEPATFSKSRRVRRLTNLFFESALYRSALARIQKSFGN
jgi:hypothetical protein